MSRIIILKHTYIGLKIKLSESKKENALLRGKVERLEREKEELRLMLHSRPSYWMKKLWRRWVASKEAGA